MQYRISERAKATQWLLIRLARKWVSLFFYSSSSSKQGFMMEGRKEVLINRSVVTNVMSPHPPPCCHNCRQRCAPPLQRPQRWESLVTVKTSQLPTPLRHSLHLRCHLPSMRALPPLG